MPDQSYRRELCTLEDELARAEIALWRRPLALPTERHHAVARTRRIAAELRLAELHAHHGLGAARDARRDS
jgi:hypothetical protein